MQVEAIRDRLIDMARLNARKVQIVGECIEYSGASLPNGYRKVGRFGVYWLAHRYAYHVCVGPIPEGLCVLHRCDNRSCVRPDHLFTGTRKDNTYDMISKRRQNWSGLRTGPWRERLPRKLSDVQKRDIARLRNVDQRKLTDLATLYGVAFQTISKIAHNPRHASHAG